MTMIVNLISRRPSNIVSVCLVNVLGAERPGSRLGIIWELYALARLFGSLMIIGVAEKAKVTGEPQLMNIHFQ